ncbi:MAG: restriction endonuclease subunit S [Bacteroidales bacterium]|nr:restriction endonuclease subunit S [Bacteroidales bacterium]
MKDVLLCKPQYGASESGFPRSSREEPRYIRITDIDENGLISYNELGATAKNIEDKYILGEKDILIARSGATVGKAYIHKSAPYACFFAGYLIRFIINTNKALPEYIFTYTQLNPYKEWVNAIQRPSGQPNINSEEYQSLEIPLPNIEKQQVIVDLIKSAYLRKKQKESEAQQLLDSIDTYILNELGITLPKIKTDLKNRIFNVNRSELEERLDPTVYKDGVKLCSNNYDNVKLSSVAYVNPTGTFKGKDIETPISFIPMESIDEIYSEVSKLEDTTIENASGFTKFKEGDLLWAKITPCMQNGKSAIAKNLTNGLGCGSTEFFVMRPKDERLAIEYLHVILHMKCVRETAMLYFGGSAGQQRVSSAFLENFNLPLPPKDKQIEIANHVYTIRQKAKALQEEGKVLLEEAKRKVESMIIG